MNFGKRRQDTWSDLQLFGIVNLAVIFLFSWLKAHLVDVADSGTSAEELNKPFWTSLYEVHARVHFFASDFSLIMLHATTCGVAGPAVMMKGAFTERCAVYADLASYIWAGAAGYSHQLCTAGLCGWRRCHWPGCFRPCPGPC